MGKHYASLTFFLLISPFIQAQNLVPNPGFEEFTSCPKDLGKKQPVFADWTQANTIPIDYFNHCSEKCGTPENIMGSQQPKSGDAYIGLTIYNETYRSYAEVELKQPLIAGTKYNVEFSVCLSEKSKFAVGNIGAYFTTQKLSSKSAELIEVYETIDGSGTSKFISGLIRPQVKNSSSNFLTDCSEWTTVIGNFKARGGEKFLTLGNFFTFAGTPVVDAQGKNKYAYYFIDDVAVYQSGTAPEAFVRTTIIPEKAVYRDAPAIEKGGTGKKDTAAVAVSAVVTSSVVEKKADEVAVKKDTVAVAEKVAVTITAAKPTILRQLFFEKNSSRILPESEDELMTLADYLTAYPTLKIEIDGHTDESGTEEGNQKLSLARAQAVANFMQMLADIDPSRMISKGWGSQKPFADNTTEDGRIKNRRVEFTVLQ